MFSNISSNRIYGKISSTSYDGLSQKIHEQISTNNKIKEAFQRTWKCSSEMKSESLDKYKILKSDSHLITVLCKDNKKILPIHHTKERRYKNKDACDEDEENDKEFTFLIESVIDNLEQCHPEILRISRKARKVLLECAKKWFLKRDTCFLKLVTRNTAKEEEDSIIKDEVPFPEDRNREFR